jgi:glutathione S-transferase
LAGAVACAAIGLGLTVWVVRTRGLLRDRALLDRWVGEATGQLQTAVEQLVATRVLTAESSLTAALGEQDEGESARVAQQVSVIDTELREHSVVGARAAALRGREMPTLKAALEAVRAELGEAAEPDDAADDEAEATSGDAGAASGTSVPSDDEDGKMDESSPTKSADNVF